MSILGEKLQDLWSEGIETDSDCVQKVLGHIERIEISLGASSIHFEVFVSGPQIAQEKLIAFPL
jgi:hypothetical protein